MGDEGLRIDHVIYGVQNLEAAAKRLEGEYQLFSREGGVHPDFGTKNKVIWIFREPPIQYVELLAVDDPSKPFASVLSSALGGEDRMFGWAVGTDQLDSVADRLKMKPQEGSITRQDGSRETWRFIMAFEWGLPFFIQYDINATEEQLKEWERHRNEVRQEEARLGTTPLGISWIEVGGEEKRVREWLGGADLPIRFIGGPPGISAVGISTSAGEIVIR